MRLNQIIQKLQNLNVEAIAIQALEMNTEQMENLNREQLLMGLNSGDEQLNPTYASMSYASMKQQMNSTPGLGNPDLKLTGAFHNSIKYQVMGNSVVSSADDPNGLESKYTDSFGTPLMLGSMAKHELKELHLKKSVKICLQNYIQ